MKTDQYMSDVNYNLAIACIDNGIWDEAALLVYELSKIEDDTAEMSQLKRCIHEKQTNPDLRVMLFSSLYSTLHTSPSKAGLSPKHPTTQKIEKNTLFLNHTPLSSKTKAPQANSQKIRIKCRFRDDHRFILLPAQEKTNFELLKRLISEKFFVYDLDIWFDGRTGMQALKNSNDLQEFFKTEYTTLLLSFEKQKI